MQVYDLLGSYDMTKSIFSFLIKEHKFSLVKDIKENYGFILEYKKDDIRVHLFHDFRENELYFNLIKGATTEFPNDHDLENISSFYSLFQRFENNLDCKSLQPNDEGYEVPLIINFEKLKKYGDGILRGLEWL